MREVYQDYLLLEVHQDYLMGGMITMNNIVCEESLSKQSCD